MQIHWHCSRSNSQLRIAAMILAGIVAACGALSSAHPQKQEWFAAAAIACGWAILRIANTITTKEGNTTKHDTTNICKPICHALSAVPGQQ